MRKAAATYLVSAVALGCLALATTTINCGGTSGERPGGTGGTTSTGGTSGGGAGGGGAGGGAGGSGAGGSTATTSTSTALSCAAAIVPANLTSGGVTDFTDWSASSGKWGSASGLYGAIYAYKDSNGSGMSASVDTATKSLHAVGSVVPNGYGGVGLSFSVCATVASFTQVSFDIMGSSPGCRMDLQIKTWDQQPTNQNPPGGCDPNGSCYNFPAATNAVDLSTPITTFKTVTIPLANVSNWSAANAGQVIGLQWQWGGTNIDPDAGVAACPIDVNVTNVKFLP